MGLSSSPGLYKRRLARPPGDPLVLFGRWFSEAIGSELSDANAMTLASASRIGRPSARIVLLKDWSGDGLFCFYTNTGSRKGRELRENGHAALLFHWKSLRCQVRIEGSVRPVGEGDADLYFATRPRGAQTGAWASRQSRPLAGGLEVLRRRVSGVEDRFAGMEIPRPPHWSGYVLRARGIEFWSEGSHRLHERVLYRRVRGGWKWVRLFP
ncbi:MAG: pyridoxamine 5'-phosphate oxidase [Alphaproteobacteria bacterium]